MRNLSTAYLLTALAAPLLFAGCANQLTHPLGSHYQQFGATLPLRNTVEHCAGYGCKKRTRFTFSDSDINQIRAIMIDQTAQDFSPEGERRALAHAIAWMEQRVGPVAGTDKDRASIDFFGAGDPGQEDCVDEATNTASYLLVLKANGLLRLHDNVEVVSRGNLLRGSWTHYGTVMTETSSGQRWVFDSGVGRNGSLPRIEKSERWYARAG